MTAKELCKYLVGMKYEMACYTMWAMNFCHRLTYRDSEEYILARDYKPARINIGIIDEIVVEAKVG
jgi:hypothetical protein